MSLDTAHAPSNVAHHFENIDQQREANSLGMWIFLVSEILFFGGVFTAYTVLRSMQPAGFAFASSKLDAWLGALNTAILLTSSLTMALAVWAAQTQNRKVLQWALAGTLFFGTGFLVIKGYEWYHEYEVGLVPGKSFGFKPDGEPSDKLKDKYTGQDLSLDKKKSVQMFFVFYFSITGLHALHMIVGIAVLALQYYWAMTTDFGIADWGPVEVAGLYWHFVDVVWIFVFPLLYLMRH